MKNLLRRLVQSVEQSSWETWFDRYPAYRRPENSILYYNKGMLICLLLDLEIRASPNPTPLQQQIRESLLTGSR